MAQSGGKILATMAKEGWYVTSLDTSKNLYELSLPPVHYEFAGAVVSIPPSRFLATLRDTFTKTGSYQERLQGDMVLQNGENIVKVELGFPFYKTFRISAAGWTRARVGWEGDSISISNSIEIG